MSMIRFWILSINPLTLLASEPSGLVAGEIIPMDPATVPATTPAAIPGATTVVAIIQATTLVGISLKYGAPRSHSTAQMTSAGNPH